MDTRPIVLLGAAGQTGRRLAPLLLARTAAPLVLAGREPARLEPLAVALRAEHGDRVTIVHADADAPGSLRAAFTGARLVAIAASVSKHMGDVAHAILDAGADGFDLVVSEHKHDALRTLAPEFQRAGRVFVTDGGFHPGLPALLVRSVAGSFDALERANVRSVIAIDWRGLAFSRSTVDEFLDEIVGARTEFLRDGRWRAARWYAGADWPVTDFGAPFGKRYGAPMALAEMRALPELVPSLREAGFWVGGFNPFVDWVVFPLAPLALRLAPGLLRGPTGALLVWGLRTFSRPPFGTLLRLEAEGTLGGARARTTLDVAHEDGYALTAAAACACVEQMLDGTIATPGLRWQALDADPARMLDALASLGARITRTDG